MRHIPVASPAFTGNEKKYVMDCLDSGWISSAGRYVKEFEDKFAVFSSARHAMSCSNGTVALHLALLALGVGSGDEVIVPTLTYIATANSVTYCGAKPVFIDSEPQTWNIDPAKIEESITDKTRGIIVVHLYGHPVDMDPILDIAKKFGLFVIEDAAEAHGALYKNKIVGSLGDIGTFSFFGNKIITTGEGGMVVTNSEALADKVRLLKGQGMDPQRRYWFPMVGYNYRMTNIQAAIGLAQLENFIWHFNKRREVASLYYKFLRGLEEFLELPVEKEWARHSFWMFSILLKKDVKISRDELMQGLEKDGIETRPVFYPMHIMPPYADAHANLPVATHIASRGINLPTHSLLTEEDIAHIAGSLERHCNKIK